MKKILLLIIVLSFQTISAQTTTTCTMEPGKGCGDVKIGKSRNEIESVFGKANSDRYYKNGFALVYNAENKVNEIMFFLNRNENIFQQYYAFLTILPGSLTAQTTKVQLTSKYGKPKMTREFDALNAKISLFEYPGIRIAFDREQLFYVEIFASKEAFILAGEQTIFEDEITFGNDDKKETKSKSDELDKLKSNIGFDLPGEKQNVTATSFNENKLEDKKVKIYLYDIDKPFLYNASDIKLKEDSKAYQKNRHKLTDDEFEQLLQWCNLTAKPVYLNTPEKIKSTINSNQESFLYAAYIIANLEGVDGDYYSVIQIPFDNNAGLRKNSPDTSRSGLYFITPYSNVHFEDLVSNRRNKKTLETSNQNTNANKLPTQTTASNNSGTTTATNKTTEPQTCKYCKGKGFTYTHFCNDCKNTGYVYVIGYETKKEFCACIQSKRLFTATQIENELKKRKVKCEICNGSGKIK